VGAVVGEVLAELPIFLIPADAPAVHRRRGPWRAHLGHGLRDVELAGLGMAAAGRAVRDRYPPAGACLFAGRVSAGSLKGGINGYPLQLIVEDDASDGTRAIIAPRS